MNTHELKVWSNDFEAIKSDKRTFLLQKNSEDYKVGDTIHLFEKKYKGFCHELNDLTVECTGEQIKVEITHILRGDGLEKGYCGISFVKPGNRVKFSCIKCEDRAYLYDNNGFRIGTCSCHY